MSDSLDLDKDPLLQAIEALLERHPNLTATDIGVKTVKDPNLVPGLRKGRFLRPKTRSTVKAWLRDFEANQREVARSVLQHPPIFALPVSTAEASRQMAAA